MRPLSSMRYGASYIVLDCRMTDDAASIRSTILGMGLIDFRNLSDDDLETYINRNPSNVDIHGAIFEHDRRKRQRDAKIGTSRHKHALVWTIVGAIAALIAAIATVWMLFR